MENGGARMKITRRNAIGILASAAAVEQQASAQQTAGRIGDGVVRWLDGAPPAVETGVSWGVPWPRGAVSRQQTFSLATAAGKSLPLQSWPLAYWPDGS